MMMNNPNPFLKAMTSPRRQKRKIDDIELKKYFIKNTDIINKALEHYLPSENKYPELIHQAIRYSVLNGGKRFRPILAIATAELLNGNIDDILPAACALEMIHSYSLIHDDLPCMDNDDFRRGRPTTHRVYGDALAIYAGVALINIAFDIMTRHTEKKTVLTDKMQQVIFEISQASGMQGMVGGQVADSISENISVTKKTLDYIHSRKTGALIIISVRTGAILSGANNSELTALSEYGKNLGLLFQITDDILDIESTEEKRGKKIGGDIEHGKATYPKLYGMRKSKIMVDKLVKDAQQNLKIFGNKSAVLESIGNYVAYRLA